MAPKKKRLPPALAKRAKALAQGKRNRLVVRGRDLLAVVREKRREVSAAFYEMGQALAELSKPDQYKALGHATFDALVEEELDMSSAYASRLILVAKKLDEARATDLGYEKSLAVASALALPAATLDGNELHIGAGARAKTIDVAHTSARDIDDAATHERHAHQRGKPVRGRTTTPEERALAEAYERDLHRAGAHRATVRCVATKPGKPADYVFRVGGEEIPLLRKVL